MTNNHYAYVRVSTVRQSVQGVSLSEQHRSIEQYANDHGIQVLQWFEEVESASKGRRVVFKELIRKVKQKKGRIGLLIHKIDRGARNLRDWADIGDLIDRGIDVRFTNDDLDLDSRAGRLTADIQAVIAADYIRNLREEVKKGISGRLHQGIYPFRAPYGYCDRGRGRVKVPHPVQAPLVVEAFREYATSSYTLRGLADKLAILGLTKHSGTPVSPSMLSALLRRRFYIGEFRVRGTTYPGQHQPLITKELFHRVQAVLAKRGRRRYQHHTFTYQRRLQCKTCHHSLIGEVQKGRVYYRCHYCRGICIREDRIPVREGAINAPFIVVQPIHAHLEPFEKRAYFGRMNR